MHNERFVSIVGMGELGGVFARGLLSRLHTRIYVPGPDLDADPFLGRLTPERRATLIATPVDGGLRHDIHLQGEKETVFLAFN